MRSEMLQGVQAETDTPPFSYELLTAAELRQYRRAAVLSMAVIPSALFALGAVLATCHSMATFPLFLLGLVLGARGYCQNYGESYRLLPATSWPALAELLAEHPELHAYRDRVQAQGRMFSIGEFNAMETWSRRRKLALSNRAQLQAMFGGAPAESSNKNPFEAA